MAPFALSLLPLLIEMAPALIRMLGGGSANTERNAKVVELIGPKIAPVVFDAAKSVVPEKDQVNEQAIVAALQGNAELQRQFNAQLAQRWDEILPALRARGKTVVAVTHDDRYFDRATRHLVMEDGRLTE